LDQSVGSIALGSSVVQLGFHPADDDASLSFFVLTSDGRLGVWVVPASVLAPPKKPHKGQPAAPRLNSEPNCLVMVAAEDGQVNLTDPQRILCAAFSAERELIAAYGSRARPHFARVPYTLPNGELKPVISLPRVGSGLLVGADPAQNGKLRAKRGRAEPPQQLGAMDMLMPSVTAARQRAPAADDNLPRCQRQRRQPLRLSWQRRPLQPQPRRRPQARARALVSGWREWVAAAEKGRPGRPRALPIGSGSRPLLRRCRFSFRRSKTGTTSCWIKRCRCSSNLEP
jgi:hypothetical protein